MQLQKHLTVRDLCSLWGSSLRLCVVASFLRAPASSLAPAAVGGQPSTQARSSSMNNVALLDYLTVVSVMEILVFLISIG